MLDYIKLKVKSSYFIFKLVRLPLVAFGYFSSKVARPSLEEFWTQRIDTVLTSPDNDKIHRVPGAGTISGDTQLMHNGLKIHVGSYYGDGNTVLLYRNKGVHEPQEEKVFEEILELLPPDATMLELGAFWAFYSMSFKRRVPNGLSYLIEPDRHALIAGKHNFRLNGFEGHFFNYGVSDVCTEGSVPSINVDTFLKQQKIQHLNILHSDIQGFELKMLMGASEHLEQASIDYILISTHSNELHEDCKRFLVEKQYTILCDANLDETYSWDGLIVAKSPIVDGPSKLEISKRT